MSSESNNQNEDQTLKYLGFFQVAAQTVTTRLSALYDYAKENSGPLKQGVDAMEGTVKLMVGPVYRKVEGKPFEILLLADRKVGDAIVTLDNHVPPTLKSKTCEVYGAVKKAPEAARSVVTNIRQVGVVEKTKEVAKTLYVKSEPAAKNLYDKYEPFAVELSLSAWYKLRQVPVVPKVVEVLIPPSAYCVEKYNSGVQYLSDGEYWVAAYLPVVPVEKIKNAIHKELEMKENNGSEINEVSEIQVDDSTEE